MVDVLFDTPGQVRLEHRTPDHTYDLGAFTVAGDRVSGAASTFETLRVDPELTAEHRSIQPDLERPPDKVLAFFSRMPLLYGGGTPTSYACPMHPDVTSMEPGSCPKCGMTLTPVFAPSAAPTLLRLSDASGGHVVRARDMSRVRHEAGCGRGGMPQPRPHTPVRCTRKSRPPSRGHVPSAA